MCPWGVNLDFLVTIGWAPFLHSVAHSKQLMLFLWSCNRPPNYGQQRDERWLPGIWLVAFQSRRLKESYRQAPLCRERRKKEEGSSLYKYIKKKSICKYIRKSFVHSNAKEAKIRRAGLKQSCIHNMTLQISPGFQQQLRQSELQLRCRIWRSAACQNKDSALVFYLLLQCEKVAQVLAQPHL